MKNKVIIGLLLAISHSSCQKIIDIKIDNIAPVLIINAQFDPEKQQDTIHLSLSNNNNQNNDVDLTVKDAQVTLNDVENNISYPLTSTNNGYYIHNTRIVNLNSTYRLDIVYQNQTYTSTTKIAKKIQQFEGKLEQTNSFNSRNTYLFTAKFTDADPNEFNYYKIKLIIDNNDTSADYFFTNDDKKIDPATVKDDFFTTIPSALNDTSKIKYEIEVLSKESYQFFQDIQQLNPNRNFILNEKPGNPIGTFNNGAIGVFSIHYTSKFE